MDVRAVRPSRPGFLALSVGAAVLATATMASAHGGDADSVHGCIVPSSGYLRIIAAHESCKKGEVPLDWSKGGSAAAIGAGSISGQGDNVAATSARGELALATVGRANLVPGAVHTDQLEASAVTGDKIATGAVTGQGDNDDTVGDSGSVTGDLGLGTVGRANLVNSSVDSTKLAGGSVDSTKLAAQLLAHLVTETELTALFATLAGTNIDTTPNESGDLVSLNEIKDLTTAGGDGRITGTFLQDGTVTANDLSGMYSTIDGAQVVAGAVTSEKLLDGTVATRDIALEAITASRIANGSIGTQKLLANAAAGTTAVGAGLGTGATPVASAMVTLTDAGAVAHKVLLNGAVSLDCASGCPSDGIVEYQLEALDGTGSAVTVGPSLRSRLSDAAAPAVLPVTGLDSRDASSTGRLWTYRVVATLSGTGADAATLQVLGSTLTAVDLGRG